MRKNEDTTPKQTLEDMLNSLDILDEEPDAGVASDVTPVSYDEFVPNELASALLGMNYDPMCKYKIITQRDATIVTKIDPSLPEDFKTVYDAHGNVVKAYMTEYVLEETDDMQESYSEMMSNVQQRYAPGEALWKVHKEHKTKNWTAVILVSVLVMSILLWLVFYMMLYRLGGV